MIEVFKTNVDDSEAASLLIQYLQALYPASHINFDLLDCDRILRMEGNDFSVQGVVQNIHSKGFQCAVLED